MTTVDGLHLRPNWFPVAADYEGRSPQVDRRASGRSLEALPRLAASVASETILVRDPAGAIEKLSSLKALGVRLAIDDFGTGYASLSYLAEFHVDVLKIPKPFVDRLDSGDPALVQAIIGIGDALGLGTVAEGIESATQADRLRGLGCELGQGYLFGKPMAADELDLARRLARPPLQAGELGRGRVIRLYSASQ